MNIELKGFQQIAVDELLTHIHAAQRECREYPQAILLSAPTGAGKTVIATAVIESLVEGDQDNPPARETTVLWLTDQPELNEQTRRKMAAHSSVLEPELVTIEQTFQEKTLTPGRVYFLNTQKLGKKSGLVSPRDERPWTLWDTIRDSIAAQPQSFLVVIDEAHRGMAETEKDREQAQTIVQRFIKGSDDFPPAPIILGISATPDRFLGLVAGRRTLRPQVDVPADEVRTSGLLKQTLLVFHPARAEPSDYTLLRAAAERIGAYGDAWDGYELRAASGESVQPLLVVQVANAASGGKGAVTATDLPMALSVIEGVLGPLGEDEIGHAFQEAISLPVGDGRSIRYVAPPDVQDDAGLKVVFFKTALTTGWDCPRAEVMMSFRRAVDHTTIAQLIGRMVRTPLARTIEDDEFLNTVSLYLPHYDKAGLDKVLGRLQQEDPEFIPPVDVRRGSERVRLNRDAELSSCFELLGILPTYDVVRARTTTTVRRVVKLSRLLDRDGITTSCVEDTLSGLLQELSDQRTRLQKTEWWSAVVKDSGTIDLRTVEWALGVGEVSESSALVPITQQNVDDLFAAAGRKLGEGLHKAYWRRRAEEDSSPRMVRRIAKLEVFVLSQDRDSEVALDAHAQDRIEHLQRQFGALSDALPPDRRDAYRQVRLTARQLEARPLGVFEHIEGRSSGTKWDSHIYVTDSGEFFYTFGSSWESVALNEAMADPGFVGWLRNEDRKDWALSVPYRMGGADKPMYPDLLTFRREGKRLVCDVLDPHDPTRDDWVPKVKGLAEYASRHGSMFGRIEAMFMEKKIVRRLDLTKERNWKGALEADGPTHLRSLFTE